ncbi:nucleotidyltransferase domain-containing protein [Ensifer sp. 4252]|uniref:nucleotidyltransferase domain-containing protein n=1 Tax=Ensifer sp. 4252 TaxID=3373915 RepID=UPI003D253D39
MTKAERDGQAGFAGDDAKVQQRVRAVRAAETILRERYVDALFAIAAGSILRGEGTPSSDIDLVVLHESLPGAWRESFMGGGFPLEVFVHDFETLNWFVDQDIAGGYPVLLDMVAGGIVVGRDIDRGVALQVEAKAMLSRGPGALAAERRDMLRYQITDLLDDLKDERPKTEMRAIAAALHQPLCDLALLGRGHWSGKGKWLPRLLQSLDPALAQRFDDVFRLAGEGQPDALVTLAQDELGRQGGPLFAGDRRDAPQTARRQGGLSG